MSLRGGVAFSLVSFVEVEAPCLREAVLGHWAGDDFSARLWSPPGCYDARQSLRFRFARAEFENLRIRHDRNKTRIFSIENVTKNLQIEILTH